MNRMLIRPDMDSTFYLLLLGKIILVSWGAHPHPHRIERKLIKKDFRIEYSKHTILVND